ncbi:hypothetical protein SPRG_01324 [Saprolegnia parasitica CBS 223.65]|uniref:Uncharacterized protein n=1 Tax=Saprolegnia parasitica (strain CBS 223.65) TaxID=695850 RepID=A0A067CXR0_SAPPC|nr:hypothetical protein SPRG_01324 [Saprolegnia parasitica CBS 223.65]KDO34050.1 hypothetical protein SPRG_01324 [Saprolegnia parasitica CBS 223.65]|eukprot:XP_012194934.1 hypothetical protein SPRG_01324 [Saprolegnia parasitica CBS 223.65]
MVGLPRKAEASLRALKVAYAKAIEQLDDAGSFFHAADLHDQTTTPAIRIDGLLAGDWWSWPANAEDVVAHHAAPNGSGLVGVHLVQFDHTTYSESRIWSDLIYGLSTAIAAALKPAGDIEPHLTHLAIDGVGAPPIFSCTDELFLGPSTMGTLVVALPSPHARTITISAGPETSTMTWTPGAGLSYAAWYGDCTVDVAPIVDGRRAYLVYDLSYVLPHTYRTAPAVPASLPATLAALAARPNQVPTTFAYRIQPTTNDDALDFAHLRDRDAAFVQALVDSGAYDVALVNVRDPTPPRTLPDAMLTTIRDMLLRAGSNNDGDDDDDDDDSGSDDFDDDADDHEAATPAQVDQLAFRAMQELYGRQRPPPRDDVELDTRNLAALMVRGAPEMPFDDHDGGNRCNEGRPYGYDQADFESTASVTEYETGSEAGLDDSDDDDDDDSDDSEHEDDADMLGDDDSSDDDDDIFGFGRLLLPRSKRALEISSAIVHAASGDIGSALETHLLDRAVGTWVGTRSIYNIVSPVLVFWPKKHRVRLLGYRNAVDTLQRAVTSSSASPLLGFDSVHALAAAVMDTVGTALCATTPEDSSALAAFILTSTPALRVLYVRHMIDLRDETSRRHGRKWLISVLTTFGWESIGPAVVELVARSSTDWKGTVLTLRFLDTLLPTTASYAQQPFFGELVIMCWYALLTNVGSFEDVSAHEWQHAISVDSRLSLLCHARSMDARVAALYDASDAPHVTWLGGHLPGPVLANIRAFLAPAHTLLAVVTKFSAAFHGLHVILPALLRLDDGRLEAPWMAPYLALVHAAIESERELPMHGLSSIFALGAKRGILSAVVQKAWSTHRSRTTLPLLRAINDGMVITSPADVRSIADLVTTTTLALNEAVADVIMFYDGMGYDDTPPVKAVHAALSILAVVSPSHVRPFVDDVIAKVGAKSDPLFFVRDLLYPTIQYLDAKLLTTTNVTVVRAPLVEAVVNALDPFLRATRRSGPTTVALSCRCSQCQRVSSELAKQAPTRSIDQVFRATCDQLRAFVTKWRPHRRISVSFVGARNMRIRMLSEAGASARRERDEACLAYLRGGDMALPVTRKRPRATTPMADAKRAKPTADTEG